MTLGNFEFSKARLTRGIVKSNIPLELFLTPGSEVRPKNFKKLFNPLNYIGSIFLMSYFLAKFLKFINLNYNY